ncbi:hypothetical protein [Exiguobacterium sp. AT1b]|uniref:hypothetical protein n=1 Tax=Exiguobacterium sp. (strain ATCC BAA-1283 / AT1b) TaxID=360911 RepID=UPI00093C3AA5|nr:hypothetical protein [Exiguobacterium sp. AT1b]
MFIVLTYKNTKDIEDYLLNLNTINIKFTYKVIIVNSFSDKETSLSISNLSKKNKCEFIECENKGYSFGNNLGINYAINNFDFKYMIVCNADTEIISLSLEELEKTDGIIAPKILTLSGRNQNPMITKRNVAAEYLTYLGFKKDIKPLIYFGIILNKLSNLILKKVIKKNSFGNKEIYGAHGSYLIFSKNSIRKLKPVFDERMFLFSEENVLAQKAKKENISVEYNKNIIIKHKEDGSMNLSNLNLYKIHKKSFITYFETWAGLGWKK